MVSRLSLRYRAFRALARLDVRHPYLVLAATLLLSAVSVAYTGARLEFRTGQEDLITASSRDSRNYLRYVKEFPELDGLIVIVRAEGEPARAELFADTLAARLLGDRLNVKSVFYRIDPQLFSDRALLYLSADDLNELSARLHENRELLTRLAAEPSLANLFRLMNEETGRAMVAQMVSGLLDAPSRAPSDAVSPRFDLGFVDVVLRGMLSQSGRFISPWDKLTGGGSETGVLRDGYIASDNGKYLLLNVAPGKGAERGPDPVAVIQGHLDRVRAMIPDVEAGMTGGPALAHAEAAATAHDIALASVLAIAGNLALIIIPFGGLVRPAFAIAALMVGVAWSFGFTTLVVGHLNLLSAVFTSVLAGIGINFPIHLMARYEEARRGGRSMEQALELAVVNTGTGVVASACIMALAFLTPTWTDFRGIAELGLVSAAGLFLCLVSALLVFPALVAVRDRNRPAREYQPAQARKPLPPWARVFRRPGLIAGVASAATVLGVVAVRNVKFDQNLLKLQAEKTEAVRFEEKLLRDSGRSSWFAVAMARDRAEAERKAAAFRKLPEVADSETIATYIPEAQDSKRAILRGLRSLVEPMQVRTPRPDAAELRRQLRDLDFKLGTARDGQGPGELSQISRLLEQAVARLEADPNAFDGYQLRMADDFRLKLELFKRNLSPGEVTEANLPGVLRQRFIGRSGTYLVQIFPRGDIWSDAPLKRFVAAVRKVDRNVTGPPIQTYSIASVMRVGYERAAILALIAVFVFVFADFRNLRDSALASVPLLFGAAWLLEAMGLLSWEFNLANLFAVPVIIGTGVDNGVNMVYRWREEADKEQLILTKAVGKSVTICSLTTIAGFAALIPATHRGISSLGWVLSLGVTFILLATLLVLPAIFKLAGAGLSRGMEQPLPAARQGRRAAGSGALLAVPAALLVLASPASVAAESASDRLVKEAETLIEAAGSTSPPDYSRVRAAIEKLKEAVRANPRNDGAYVDLGFAYAALKDSETAIEMYRKATEINPNANNFKELADVYLRSGQPDEALMAANAGLSKSPKNAGLYNARGMALNDMTRFDEAEKDFRTALSLDPSLLAARANLAAIEERSSSTVSKAAKKQKSQ